MRIAARDRHWPFNADPGLERGEAAVLPEIRKANGVYIGTFSFFPENWGQDILELAVKIARKQSVPEVTRPTKEVFVTRENIDRLYPQ